jgi:predicted Zn-dependent protease with MMP-like domain
MVFVFASINVLYYIYRFVYVEPFLHPWDEANLVVVSDLSVVLLESVCHYFIEDFCIDVH